VASKKCPKCGEDNPAEAVMCWACYTPLSGGPAVGGINTAAAALGAKGPIGKGPAGVPVVEEESGKKGIDPKLIGVGAFLLIAGVVAFLVNTSMSSTGSTTDFTNVDPPAVDPGRPSGPSAPAGQAPPTMGTNNNQSNNTVPPPVPLQFRTVTSPNPRYATGTVGILIAADKSNQAAGFARYAKDQLARNGKWRNFQVCVFTDQGTANQFKSYQAPRKGEPLQPADFAKLASSGVWNNTPVFYESKGKVDRVLYPSKSPNGFWSGA
jgi:hypothetical protein